jgi:integrase
VFCNDVGEHQDDNWISNEFYAALERAALGHLRWLEPPSEENPEGLKQDDAIAFHDLRRTMGTLCASAGIDLRKMQAWMGHADIQTTMRYLHYVPAHDDAAWLTAAFAREPAPVPVLVDEAPLEG